MRKLRIEHVTAYHFERPVQLLPHRLMLRPRENHDVRITSSLLNISPSARVRWQRDTLDNSIAIASFDAPATELRIESKVQLEHYDERPLDFCVAEEALFHPFAYPPEDVATLRPFLEPTWPADRQPVSRWLARHSIGAGRSETFVLLDSLNRYIAREFAYQTRHEPGVQSPAVTLARGLGSCRDLAALFLEACRCLGLAARFVSGYHTSYEGEGAGSTHAWAEVYLPGPGWKGFDPSSGLVTGCDHIAVGVAHHPESLPPVSGSYLAPDASRPKMDVTVRVSPM